VILYGKKDGYLTVFFLFMEGEIMNLKKLMFYFITAISSVLVTESPRADYVWHTYNGHEYALTLNYGTWQAAEQEAVSQRGHLVTIDDLSENNWLKSTFQNTYMRSLQENSWAAVAWIGAYKEAGTWKWISGDPPTIPSSLSSLWVEQIDIWGYLLVNPHPWAGQWGNDYTNNIYDRQPKGIIEREPHEIACSGFMPPFDQALVLKNKVNRAIPVKIQLTDADGNTVTDLDIEAPPVINVLFDGHIYDEIPTETDDLLPIGLANQDNIFRFVTDTGQWAYNLGTKQFKAPGTYTVIVKSGDASEYQITTPNGACTQTFERRQ
jgi:hypothetical protein